MVITRWGKPFAELVSRCVLVRDSLPEQASSGVETMRVVREETRA
ncbi:MAG: hypothetical protein QUV07_16180 [Cyanobium sp. CZS 25K]|nr:hypothetical protein [Cyanobium sp. CZS25K]